jgi:hypothetical protein
MSEEAKNSGGGAATQGGIGFQNRVAAWVGVMMLAERPATPIGPAARPIYLRFETPEPTDDLLVGCADSSHAFGQAKRSLNLSAAPDSEFASVVEQFVRQYLSTRNESGPRPWQRPLNPLRDRVVLATTSRASAPVRVHLRAVLDRARGLVAGQPLSDAAVNQDEKDALETVLGQARRVWQAVRNEEINEADALGILKLMYVVTLDVEADEAAEREALNLLAMAVVRRSGDEKAAWARIVQIVGVLSQRRSGIDVAGLRAALQETVPLKTAPSYENDIEKLRKHSEATLGYLEHNSRITMGSAVIRAERAVMSALQQAGESDSIVVVGVPGAGKSGVLHDYSRALINEGRDVICLATDQVAAKSLGELRNELGLEHDILDVISNWPGDRTAFLVIDALDASRGDPAGAALVSLMDSVVRKRGRWHVVASIRKYDLRYSPVLRELFRTQVASGVSPEFQDAEFARERHVNVPLFTDTELASVRQQSHDLDQLLTTAPVALHDLIRVPFNLRLMADIVHSGVNIAELRPIRTQSELLNRFWQYRVLGHPDADLRERIIRHACRLMIADRRLRTERQRIVEPGSTPALKALLSGQVLIEWQTHSSAVPDRQIIAFAHNILFDFAASQLFLPREADRVAEVLSHDPDLVLIIRPSFVMRFEQLWREDRAEFWKLLFHVSAAPDIPIIGKLIGVTVLGDLGAELDDLEPLIAALQSPDADTRQRSETVFRHLVGALTATDISKLAGPDAGPWNKLLVKVTKQ